MPLPKSISCMHPTELPLHKVAPYGKKTKVFTLSGENAEKEFWSSLSVSTYPMLRDTNIREGDPIADKVACTITKNRVIVAVADGCNWGVRPEQAAVKATISVRDYLTSKQNNIKDLQDAGHYLYRAFCVAHNKIIEGKEDIWEAGTTTLLSGMCLELVQASESDPKWCFVCASVGDCKAFLISKKNGNIVDITAGNRINQKDARDPGGRLGPYLDHGNPDLRNMSLYYIPCEEGDLIVIVSDGVHDNFDPQQLGKTPQEVGLDHANWEEVDRQQAEKVKTAFRNRLMRELLDSIEPLSPSAISERLVDHCVTITKNVRDWMESHPKERQPADPVSYPGKMDHTTACTFVVGQVETLSEGPEDPYVEPPQREPSPTVVESPRASPNLTRKKSDSNKKKRSGSNSKQQ